MLGLNGFSQEQLNDTQLKEDFTILTKVVCEVSPNLSAEEKESLYKYLNEKSKELDGKVMTTIEFFKFLMNLKANTKLDEHGSLSLSNEVMKALLTEKNALFPIPIVIINNKLIVNHEQVQIPYGSVITDINGMPIETILEDMLKEKSTFALHNLEQSFDVLFLIKYGVPDTYTVTYTKPNSNTTETINLEPVDIKTRESIYTNMVYPIHREQLKNVINTAYFEDTDSYYIQLNSFNWNEEVKNVYDTFDKQFSETFKTIKKQNPKQVIIDLRYNRGGLMVIPSLFYSYIAQNDFTEYMALKVPDFDLPYKDHIFAIENKNVTLEEVENFIKDFQKPFTKNNDYYENIIIDKSKREANKKGFNGTVYLLIGGRTFSAASYFTAIFKSNNRGQILGEQIGGSHHNITAGKQIVYDLPNTKIRLSLPMGLFKFSHDIETKVPEQKIVPDVFVSDELKYQYLLNKEDWDLKEILNFIEKKK